MSSKDRRAERAAAEKRLDRAYEALDDDYAERILHGGPWDEDDTYNRLNTEAGDAAREVSTLRRLRADMRRGRDRDNWPPR